MWNKDLVAQQNSILIEESKKKVTSSYYTELKNGIAKCSLKIQEIESGRCNNKVKEIEAKCNEIKTDVENIMTILNNKDWNDSSSDWDVLSQNTIKLPVMTKLPLSLKLLLPTKNFDLDHVNNPMSFTVMEANLTKL